MKKNILIVDDHAPFREFLRALLTRMPDVGQIREAEGTDQAVEMARDDAPDMIFMDLGMDKDGFEALRIIHQTHPEVKIIILTVYAKNAFVEKALKLGAVGYLIKKDVNRELAEAVESVFAGKKYISREVERDPE
ncbi:MAG: response regulator transcription factor [bacterium]